MSGLTKLSREWERLCMCDDPFAGDFGGSGDSDRVLLDKMVTNRKGGICQTCGGECAPGTRNRVRTEVYDGKLMRFRWCQGCCRAMAVYGQRPSILEARIARLSVAPTPSGITAPSEVDAKCEAAMEDMANTDGKR